MELILIILTSTIISVLFFAVYNYGIHVGMNKQIEHDKHRDVLEVDNRDKHERIREYKKFSEFQG